MVLFVENAGEFNQPHILIYCGEEALCVKYTNKAHRDILADDKISPQGCFTGALIALLLILSLWYRMLTSQPYNEVKTPGARTCLPLKFCL